MKLTFLGHAATRLQGQGHEVLIDPFLKGNPVAPIGPDDVDPDHIILTHAHGDHVGDTVAIADRTGATVISSADTVRYLARSGVKGHGMNVGGSHGFPFGRVTFTPAWHSNSFADGSYGGMPMGVVIEWGEVTVYHAGDTAYFSDMALIARFGVDVALLPIGDNYTMGPRDALEAVRAVQPRAVVPIHYDTFDLIAQDAHAFARSVEDETDAICHVLAPGEALEL